MNFEIYYKKNNNKELFKNLENQELTELSAPQNYIPIYHNFFSSDVDPEELPCLE